MKSKISVVILASLFIGLMVFANVFVNQYILNQDKFLMDEGKINLKEKQEEEKMNILKLNHENFEEEVLKSKKTVLIDFFADWCGPCKMMSPIVEAIAEENPAVKVGKINVDEEEELAIQYQVMSIPTFLIIKNGEVVDKIVGAVDKSVLEEAIGG